MFMRENRKKNGAQQPEAVAKAQSGGQSSSKKLSPNVPVTEKLVDWRFNPNMGSCDAINRDHYQAGIGGDGPYGTSYESNIPFVGNDADKQANPALKG